MQGWIGERVRDLEGERIDHGLWRSNRAAVPGLEACADLDLACTPATNLPQLRRLALSEGEAATVTAAWLDLPGATRQVLPLS
jgi:hypothetical protein